MTVLVAYGTMSGSTAEIARWIGTELEAAGLAVEVRPASDVEDVTGYQAVILGGSVYAAGWHPAARRFAQRFAAALVRRPVWLFSSGPLDTSADERELPPGPHAATAMRLVQARGHVTFGGRISEQAHGWLGFVSHRMTTAGHVGDFRNPARVRAWARRVAADIKASAAVTAQRG